MFGSRFRRKRLCKCHEKKYKEQGHNQGLFVKDQDQDQNPSVKEQDKNKDFKFVLKDSL